MNRLIAYAFCLGLVACTRHATRPSADVTFRGNYLLYRGSKFTGILEERFEQVGTVRYTHYRDGLIDGTEEERFPNGRVASRREYSRGQKVGAHEGWYASGKRRFHHEFTRGEPDGEAWEWYESGGVSLYARFETGRLLGKKMWRENGQIYMNYVFPRAQAAAGVPGAKLCYQVRGETPGATPTPAAPATR